MRELIEKLIESILRKLTNVTWQKINDEPGSTTSFYKIQHTLGGDPKVLEEYILNPMRAQFKEAFSKQYPEFKFTDEVFNQVMTMVKSTSEQDSYRIKVDPAALEQVVTAFFKAKYGKKQSSASNAGVESKSVKPMAKEFKTDVMQSERKDQDKSVKQELKTDNAVVESKAKDKLLKVRVIFVLDKTMSMTPCINAAIEQLCQVTGLFNEKYPKADVQFALVAFSDFPNVNPIQVFPFATSETITTNLRTIQVETGNDWAEFVNGGLQEANLLADQARADKKDNEELLLTSFLLTDSVPHGFARQLILNTYPEASINRWDYHQELTWEEDVNNLSNKGCPLNVLTCITTTRDVAVNEIHDYIAANSGGVRFDFGNMNAFRTIVGSQLEADATVSLAIGDAISEKVQALSKREDLSEDELVREAVSCASSSGDVIAAMSSSGTEVTMEKLENAVRRQLIRSNVGSSAGPISGRSSSGPALTLSQPGMVLTGMVSNGGNSQPGLTLPDLPRPMLLSGINGVTVNQAANSSGDNMVQPQAKAGNASSGSVRTLQPGLDSGLTRYKPLSTNPVPSQSQPGMDDLSNISRGLRNLKGLKNSVNGVSPSGPNNGSDKGPAKPDDQPQSPAKKA